MHDVITIGSATRDVFVKSVAFEVHEDDGSVTGIEGCFPLGAKIEIDDIIFDTGGGATNSAVAFSRLGFATAVIGSIGMDSIGREVVEGLETDGVDTTFLRRHHEHQTGYSVILLAGTGERTILVYRGASKHLHTDTVPWNDLRTGWIYMTSLGGNVELAERVLDHAAGHGIKVAWNPGGEELKLGMDRLGPLIRKADVFNLNREEAALLVHKEREDLKGIMDALQGLPRKVLLVTGGGEGTLAAFDGKVLHSGTIDAPKTNTTGAGDAFGSGFVAGLMKKDDIPYALAVGTWNATGVVQEMGAKRGLMRRFPPQASIEKVTVTVWN